MVNRKRICITDKKWSGLQIMQPQFHSKNLLKKLKCNGKAKISIEEYSIIWLQFRLFRYPCLEKDLVDFVIQWLKCIAKFYSLFVNFLYDFHLTYKQKFVVLLIFGSFLSLKNHFSPLSVLVIIQCLRRLSPKCLV